VRWGEWYVHDASHVKHVRLGVVASHDDLADPAALSAFVLRCPLLSATDVVALITCANELLWFAFDFVGIGDWVDADGVQRGQEHRSAAAGG
jgi:hypothetical protein